MKTKLIKGVSVLLAAALLVIASSFLIGASDFEQAVGLVASDGGKVVLDGTNDGSVTVSIVLKEKLTCYNIEGLWDLNEQGDTEYFALEELALNEDLEAGEFDFADVPSGQIMWVDDNFDAVEMNAGYVLATATYAVAAETPAGDYTLGFTKDVFTDGTGEPDETKVAFTVKITVEVDAGEEETGLLGDVDLDGDVDAYDLTALARHIGGIEIVSNTTALTNADVDTDGDVDAYDLTKHARFVGGIITEWDQE